MKRHLSLLALIVLAGAGCTSVDALKQAATDAATNAAKTAAQKVEEGAAKGAIKAGTGQDVDVKVTDNGLSFTDKNGASFVAGDNVAIPSSFPKDVPVYANGKPTSIQVIKAGESASLLFTTKDDRTAIRDWYLSEADKGGWKIDGTMETADNIIISFSRVEGDATAKMTVTIQPKSIDGTVQVMVVRKGV